MRRKGISPLIAAVLLIAFTMAVAGILTAWVTSFTQSTTEDVGNESDRLIECSYAGLDITSASFDGTDATVVVANTGTQDINASVVVYLNNGTITQTYSDSIISRGSVANVDLSSPATGVGTADGDIDRVQATSIECPEVTAETQEITDTS